MCAADGKICNAVGDWTGVYGVTGKYVAISGNGPFTCLPKGFVKFPSATSPKDTGVDDPASGVVKSCYIVGKIEAVKDEVVRLANDTPYGLNAMLFTENVRRAHRVAAKLQAGTVWVNCFFIRDLRAPFGGFKQSGIGREGGKYSREFFTEPKAIVMEI